MKIKNLNKFLEKILVFFLYMFSKMLLNSNHETTKIKSNTEINTTEYFNISANKIIRATDVKILKFNSLVIKYYQNFSLIF